MTNSNSLSAENSDPESSDIDRNATGFTPVVQRPLRQSQQIAIAAHCRVIAALLQNEECKMQIQNGQILFAALLNQPCRENRRDGPSPS